MRPLTVSRYALCALATMTSACGATLATHVSSDDAALGKVVVYRNGIAYYERAATIKEGQATLTVPHDKVDDFLKSLTVADARTGKPLPIAYPTQGANESGHVDMQIQVQDPTVRDVVITYITAAPAWKPSYRVVVREDGALDLQGWAIVDNTSGEAWEKVHVGVGSSSALSFRFDLRSVREVFREELKTNERVAIAPPAGATTWRDQEAQPEVVANFQEDELRSAAAPSVAEQKRSGDQATKPQAAQPRRKVQSVASQLKREQGTIVINSYGKDARHAREALDRGNMLRNQLIEEGIAPARVRVEFQESASRADVELVHAPQAPVVGERASVEEAQTPVGESHFQSNAPITVAPGTSALISVLDKRAEGDVVYVYDPHGERGHKRFAFRAVRLINPTRYTLETGPVTVYGEERFIGEGLTEPIAPGATAMIPFALDRQIIIEPTHRTGDRISRLSSVERGIMRTEVQYERRTSYKVSSLRRDATSVFIKHDVQRGWRLIEHPTLHERSGESHLFEVKLAPQETKTVEIVESTPLVKTFDLRTPAAIELVSLYLESAQVDPRFRASMDGLLKLHRELANLSQQMEVIRSRINEYRTRMIELEDQLITLREVPNAKTLLSHLQDKLKEISARVQTDTIALVDCEQQIMMARVRFQDGLSELTLERPTANTAAAANAPTGTGG